MNLWIRTGRLFLACTLTVLASGTMVSAQDDEDASAIPTQVVIFVLDLSASMNAAFDDTQTKLDVAKAAFAEAFGNVSPSAFVGLRVYGDLFAAVPPAAREEACATDTRLVVPITQVDRERLIQEVQAFEARGDTPIALALRAANDDIPADALGTVVLFSDGRDECYDADLDGDPAVGPSWGEDPCEVARELAGEGVDLRIDRVETVGFRADAAAEAELRCIADVTGGSYTAVETPEDVRDVLPRVLAEISSPREAERLGGDPIAGTPTRDGAPELPRLDGRDGNDGRFVDTIEMNSERWYRVSEYGPAEGTFTATAFGLPAQEGIHFGLRIYLPDTDQTFFEHRSDPDAGLPRRPTASIRCPGCSVTGGPNDAYWVVSLATDNPDLGGTYDLELLTEGPAFGGFSTSCREPQQCWYEEQIELRTDEVDEARARRDELAGRETDPANAADRDELAAEIDERSDQLASLGEQVEPAVATADNAQTGADDAAAMADDAEAQADGAEAMARDLAQQSEEVGGPTTSYALPIALALIGLGIGGGAWLASGRRHQPAGTAPGGAGIVTGNDGGTTVPTQPGEPWAPPSASQAPSDLPEPPRRGDDQ